MVDYKNPLNIVFLPDGLYPNKRALVSEVWLKRLVSRGHKVHTFLPSFNKSKSKVVNIIKLPSFRRSVFSIVFRILYPIKLFLTLRIFLKKNPNIEIIQVRNSIINSIIGIYFSRRYNIPFSFLFSSLHGYCDKEISHLEKGKVWSYVNEPLRYMSCKFYDYILLRSSLIQPISVSMKNLIQFKNERANYFPMPLSHSSDFTLKSNYSRNKEKLEIVYLGSLNNSRNPLFIVEFAKELLQLSSNFHLTIIGKSNDATQYRIFCQKILVGSLKNHITILESLDYSSLPHFLQNFDVGISPIPPLKKYIPSTPTKVMEYMATGLFVISNSEIIDQRDIYIKSKSGFCINYSPKDFAKAANFLIKRRYLIRYNASKAKTWVVSNRSYNDLVENLEKEYYKIKT